MRYRDRAHAGSALADVLRGRVDPHRAIVLGLPRGGVPVAAEVARALGCPLDVFVVRKLGVPGQEELAMGAVASGGVTVRNEQVLEVARISPAVFEQVRERELAEVARREQAYRGPRPPVELAGREVVVVDDGLATGATMRAALAAVRAHAPYRIVAAVPVGARSSCVAVAEAADELVCLQTPAHFEAVGRHYDDFDPTPDSEVVRALGG